MRKALIALATFCSMFALAKPAHSQTRPKMLTIKYAINLNWCGNIRKSCRAGHQAYEVAGCETGNTYDIWASNGQYKGLWQMGAHERKLFGHGWNAWDQAKAAHKYYIASGRDWSPWSCRWAAY